MSHRDAGSASGSTLIEVLVATAILVTVLSGVSQMFVHTARFARDAERRSIAVLMAQSKIEALRASPFRYGPDGRTVTDPRLIPSPEDALSADTPGYVDRLDASGAMVIADPLSGPLPAYVRRWRVAPLDDRVPDALALEVCVFRAPAVSAAPVDAEACLSTIRVRQP